MTDISFAEAGGFHPVQCSNDIMFQYITRTFSKKVETVMLFGDKNILPLLEKPREVFEATPKPFPMNFKAAGDTFLNYNIYQLLVNAKKFNDHAFRRVIMWALKKNLQDGAKIVIYADGPEPYQELLQAYNHFCESLTILIPNMFVSNSTIVFADTDLLLTKLAE